MTTDTSLYKYLAEEHAVGMLERGNVRIGTLYEYRTHWNDQVRDEEEAKFSANQHFDVYTKAAENEVSPSLKGNIYIGNGRAYNLNIGRSFDLPDRNIYCMTKLASEQVMKDFNCNACVEIVDVKGFIGAILDHFKQEGLSSGVGDWMDCTYDGRALDHSRLIEPTHNSRPNPNNSGRIVTISSSVYAGYFAKAKRYHAQHETRLLIDPATKEQNIEPIIHDIPGIIPCIRRHTF